MLDEILKLGRFVNKVKLDTTPYDGMVWYGTSHHTSSEKGGNDVMLGYVCP